MGVLRHTKRFLHVGLLAVVLAAAALVLSDAGHAQAAQRRDGSGCCQSETAFVLAAPASASASTGISPSPDGQWIVQSFDAGETVLVNLEDNTEVIVGGGMKLAWSPDSSRVVIVDGDGNAAVWRVATGELVAELESITPYAQDSLGISNAGPYSLEWSPNGKYILYTEFRSSLLCIWEAATAGIERCAELESNVSPRAGWAADSSHVAILFDVGLPLVYDLRTDTMRTLGDQSFATVGAISPDRRLLAVGTDPNRGLAGPIVIFDILSGDTLHTFDSMYTNPTWRSDGRALVVDVVKGGRITGQTTLTLNAATGTGIGGTGSPANTGVETRTGGDALAFNNYDGLYWIAADGTGRRSMVQGIVTGFAWSPGGTHIAYAAHGGSDVPALYLLDVATGRSTWVAQAERLTPVAWHDSRIAFVRVTAEEIGGTRYRLTYIDLLDGEVRYHDVSEEKTAPHIEVAGRTLLSWSPDGEWLAWQDYFADPVVYHAAGEYPPRAVGGTPTWVPDAAAVTYIDCPNFEHDSPCPSAAIWRHDMVSNQRVRVATVTPGEGEFVPYMRPGAALDAAGEALAFNYPSLYILEVDSGGEQQVTQSAVMEAIWSPDGDRLAYIGYEFSPGGIASYEATGLSVLSPGSDMPKQVVSEQVYGAQWQPALGAGAEELAQLIDSLQAGESSPDGNGGQPAEAGPWAGPTANQNANLRAGPGTNYGRVGQVKAGAELAIVGRNAAGDWCQLASGEWIAAFLVDDLTEDLPVVESAAAPRIPAVAANPPPAAAACATPVDGQLADLWDRSRLGCPLQPASLTWSSWTPFERGDLIWRRDINRISALYRSGWWQILPDQWDQVSTPPSRGNPPAGLQAPERGAGWIWGTNDTVYNELGWATYKQSGFCALVQQFERGFILRSSMVEFCQDTLYNHAREGDWPLDSVVAVDGGGWTLNRR